MIADIVADDPFRKCGLEGNSIEWRHKIERWRSAARALYLCEDVG